MLIIKLKIVINMVTCTTSGCHNTSVKGVKMNYFPKDISRRKIWIKNAKLDKILSSSATLCEVFSSFIFNFIIF